VKANHQDKYIEPASDDETRAESKARRKKIRQSLESEADRKQPCWSQELFLTEDAVCKELARHGGRVQSIRQKLERSQLLPTQILQEPSALQD